MSWAGEQAFPFSFFLLVYQPVVAAVEARGAATSRRGRGDARRGLQELSRHFQTALATATL